MMKTAFGVKWERTENPLIFQSQDATMIKILCRVSALAKPQAIMVLANQMVQTAKQREAKTSESDLLKEMISHIPYQVWSKNADVGLVKSANPVKVELKPNVKLPNHSQYPLKPEAEEGVSWTIEGFVGKGVLVETDSVCNTPIFPVLKADKSKYRLAHELRMINAIVQDWPAEVPNPYTLLTNVTPNAIFFTVIDLCSAFFSVPLAEESRYLFAFTYIGKKYTYTRLPQGFKHSPHVFALNGM